MMFISKIRLNFDDLQEFIGLTSSFPQNINLCQDLAVVSGKSIMGLMSLDLSKDIKLIIHDTEDNIEVSKMFSKYIIK